MEEKTIYALGFFDGVHLGHQALLRECRRMADRKRCRAGVVTFVGHPDALVTGSAPPLITSRADRERLLRHYGIDAVVELPFDRKLMTMPYLTFFRMLVSRYHAAGLVCGEDFRFGSRGEGDAQKLQSACLTHGIDCVVVPRQFKDGVALSSTYIRALLERGDMEQAMAHLGHPHIFTGTVVPGQHLGRTIGIPTANLVIPRGVLIPRAGVYACRAWIGASRYPAVTNVGVRPTVQGQTVTVEPWILDFEGDLYGRELTLGFYSPLRPERKFPSLEALREEILKNAAETRKYFEKP